MKVWFFLYGGSSTTMCEVKINYNYPRFLKKILYSNVNGALKFTQNDIINC